MAKSMSETEIKQQLAARQGRKGGRFLPLPENMKVAYLRAAQKAAEAAASDASTKPDEIKKIGLPTSKSDAAAAVLIREAKRLSDEAQFADNEEAQRIYEKLQAVRDIAKKAKGSQSELAAKLDGVIDPIEKELKKKASFRGFLKEKVQEFRKTLPERLASKIPVVGGLLGGFLRQKRESKDKLQRYSVELEKQMAGEKRGGGGRGGFMGGSRAGDIPGLIGGDKDTLGGILHEVSEIRKLLIDQFKPGTAELAARESELEGKGLAKAAGGDGKKGGGLLSMLRGLLGGGEGGGILSTIGNIATSAGSLAMGGARGVGRLAMSAGRGIAKLGGKALGAFKGTSLYKDVAAIGKGAMNLGKSAVSSIASSGVGKAVGSAASTAGGWFSSLAGKAGGMLSSMNPVNLIKGPIASGAGKIVKGIASIPGLGAIISGVLGAVDIASIKSNPDLSVEEKKEQIGRTIVGTVGEALGSIGGGALGTFIPIPGIGTLVGSLGGSWVGGKIAELLADQLGGKGFYDMVASIPGVGSLIEVGGAEDQKTQKEAGAEVNKVSSGAAGSAGEGGASTSTMVEGKITAPATANTSMGRMVSQYSAEQNALSDARSAASAPAGGNTTNSANIQTKISTTNNNFNDDLRIRNNEPTQKQMQAFSMVQ